MPSSTPCAMSRRLLAIGDEHGAGGGVEADVRIGVADAADGLARDLVVVTRALVVISPASTTRLSLTSVSAATREVLSCFRIASSTASEIWSATLSGWPSDTDSEVKRKSLIAGVSSTSRKGARIPKLCAASPGFSSSFSPAFRYRRCTRWEPSSAGRCMGYPPPTGATCATNLALAGYTDARTRRAAIAACRPDGRPRRRRSGCGRSTKWRRWCAKRAA